MTPCATSQDESQLGKPLTLEEKRLIAVQLVEMWMEAQRVKTLEDFIAKTDALHAQEIANCEQMVDIKDGELKISAAALSLCEKQKAIETDKAVTYKALFEAASKKKAGVGCWIARIFTFGMARCGN